MRNSSGQWENNGSFRATELEQWISLYAELLLDRLPDWPVVAAGSFMCSVLSEDRFLDFSTFFPRDNCLFQSSQLGWPSFGADAHMGVVWICWRPLVPRSLFCCLQYSSAASYCFS